MSKFEKIEFKTKKDMIQFLLDGGELYDIASPKLNLHFDGNYFSYGHSQRDINLEDIHGWYTNKEWYESVPENGVICWVWDSDPKERVLRVIVSYDNCSVDDYVFLDKNHTFWKYAEPVKPEELYHE